MRMLIVVLTLFFTVSINISLNAENINKVDDDQKLSYENTNSLYFNLMTFSSHISTFTFGVPIRENKLSKGDVYVRVVRTNKSVIRVERYVKIKNKFRLSSLFKFDDQGYVIYSKQPEFNNGPEIYYFQECTRCRNNNYKEFCIRSEGPDQNN